MVRSRPRFLDPQLNQGELRFANKRGFSFTALVSDNKSALSQTAFRDDTTVVLSSRPSWYQISCLVRIGPSEDTGELNIIQDVIDTTSLQVEKPLVQNYVVSDDAELTQFVTLAGIPGSYFAVSGGTQARRILLIESWYKLVPGDSILSSPTPQVLDSLAPYTLTRVNLIGTRAGTGVEPATVYRYEVEVGTDSGLISFTPTTGMPMYVKPQPLFQRGDFGAGDLKIPTEVGPCLIDAFYGGLIFGKKVRTQLGIKTWDSFGNQLNAALIGNQEWQAIPSNYLLLERPIQSESLILWQRLQGQFQLIRGGFFQAELDSKGEFVMSTDLLVPKWPSDRQHGWVIPLISQSPITVSVQFEPQERQYFTVPSNTLTFIRPKLFVDPARRPIDRIVLAIKGSPNSRVEMRTWEYDGSAVTSLSYYILGQAAFGADSWLAGGFCVKPIFYNLDVLKARYSDGSSRYNAGYVYM